MHNIDEIRVIPVGAVDIYAVVIVALLPAIPVVSAAIPFNTLMQAAVKLLFRRQPGANNRPSHGRAP